MKHILFVYGTLKKGFSNHHFLKDAEYIGNSALYGARMLNLGAFPGVVDGNDDEKVEGEVYRIDDKTLESIDRLEGTPWLYKRESVEVDDLDDPVFVYIYQGNQGDVVPDGVWKK